MSAALAAARRHARATAFFLFAFFLLPLAVVAWRGGGTLESRFQQWNALHQSIQSRDSAREAIDDPDADTALIASFLFPSDERRSKARALYEQWRADRDWWTTNAHLRSIEKDGSGTSATVVHEFEMKLLREGAELERRRVLRSESWEKADGVWYLRRTEERVLEVLGPRPLDFIVPETPIAGGANGGVDSVHRIVEEIVPGSPAAAPPHPRRAGGAARRLGNPASG